MQTRPEQACDAVAIDAVHKAAFPTDVEARLVDLLRHNGKATVSLVAECDGQVVGHVLFSPACITRGGKEIAKGVGLAPVAVLPQYQRQGIGARLIEDGLSACRTASHPFVIVLGEPAYYHRFGFERAGNKKIDNEYGVDEPFMVLELEPGSLPRGGGLACYAPEFAEVDA